MVKHNIQQPDYTCYSCSQQQEAFKFVITYEKVVTWRAIKQEYKLADKYCTITNNNKQIMIRINSNIFNPVQCI